MSNRREFLHSCTAIAGVLVTSRLFADVPASQAQLRPTRAVFDDGFAEGRSFARAARDLGMATHAISGDVTRLWYHDLYFQWRQGPVVIAGLTGASALFCLEHLARDAGHRVLLRVDHARAADGSVSHRFQGPAGMRPPAILQARELHSDWSAGMAEFAAQCPAPAGGHESRTLAGVSRSAHPWCEPLVSWVIAPRALA